MVDLELVAPADGRQQRRDDGLVEVQNALAARAYEVVVMLGVARDVRGDVPVALEPAGHPILDLRLERAIHGRAAERRVAGLDAQVELLRALRTPRGGQGLGDDHALTGEAPALRRHSLRDLGRGHPGNDNGRLTLDLMFPSLRPNLMKGSR